MLIKQLLKEGLSHPVIVVDVQPEYSSINDGNESSIFVDIIKFVVNQTGPVLMFVNAEHTGVSGDSQASIKQYWEDSVCSSNNTGSKCNQINWGRFQIVDKGYGYLRSWMDQGVSEAVIIRVIRELYSSRVGDTRDLFGSSSSISHKEQFQKLLGSSYREWMLDDPLVVNWVSVGQLKRFSGAYLVGGGRNECLREIELLMSAFNIKSRRIDSLVYG